MGARAEIPGRKRPESPPSPSFCDEVCASVHPARGGAISGHVSLPGTDIRTPHMCPGRPSATFEALDCGRIPAFAVSSRGPSFSPNVTCSPRAPHPLAFTSARAPIDFPPGSGPGAEDCDAIPQRNCGRFSRPSLFPKSYKEPRRGHVGVNSRRMTSYSIHQRIRIRRYVSCNVFPGAPSLPPSRPHCWPHC